MTPKDFLASLRRYEKVQSGMGSEIYQGFPFSGDPVAVKIPLNSRHSTLDNEADILRQLSPHPKAPKLLQRLEPDLEHPQGGLVLSWHEGHPPKSRQDIIALAPTIASLHKDSLRSSRASSPPLSELYQDMLHLWDGMACVAEPWPLTAQAADNFAALADLCPNPQAVSIVHSDLVYGNILIQPQGDAVILDWEYARPSHPLWDIAHLLSPTTAHWTGQSRLVLSKPQRKLFVEAYARVFELGPPDALLLALSPAIWLIAARCVVWAKATLAANLPIQRKHLPALKSYSFSMLEG